MLVWDVDRGADPLGESQACAGTDMNVLQDPSDKMK